MHQRHCIYILLAAVIFGSKLSGTKTSFSDFSIRICNNFWISSVLYSVVFIEISDFNLKTIVVEGSVLVRSGITS